MRENEGDPCPVTMVNLDDAMVRKERRGKGMSDTGVGCERGWWSVWVVVSKLVSWWWWGACGGMMTGV